MELKKIVMILPDGAKSSRRYMPSFRVRHITGVLWTDGQADGNGKTVSCDACYAYCHTIKMIEPGVTKFGIDDDPEAPWSGIDDGVKSQRSESHD